VRGLPERQGLTASHPLPVPRRQRCSQAACCGGPACRRMSDMAPPPQELCSPLKRCGLLSAESPLGPGRPAVPQTGAEEHGTLLLAIGCDATEWRRSLGGRPASRPVSRRADRARRAVRLPGGPRGVEVTGGADEAQCQAGVPIAQRPASGDGNPESPAPSARSVPACCALPPRSHAPARPGAADPGPPADRVPLRHPAVSVGGSLTLSRPMRLGRHRPLDVPS
jgi:hypothetical protein